MPKIPQFHYFPEPACQLDRDGKIHNWIMHQMCEIRPAYFQEILLQPYKTPNVLLLAHLKCENKSHLQFPIFLALLSTVGENSQGILYIPRPPVYASQKSSLSFHLQLQQPSVHILLPIARTNVTFQNTRFHISYRDRSSASASQIQIRTLHLLLLRQSTDKSFSQVQLQYQAAK